MSWLDRGPVALLLTTGLLLTVLAGCLGDSTSQTTLRTAGPAAETTSTGPRAGVWTNSSEWQAAWAGDLAVGAVLETNATTHCRVVWASWGVSEHLAPTFGYVARVPYGTFMDIGRGQGNLDASATVHAAETIDHEAVHGRYGWADWFNGTFSLEEGQRLEFVGFARGLQPDYPGGERPSYTDPPSGWDNSSALLRLDCDRPVGIESLWTSSDVIIFDEETFRGGAGAHVRLAFDVSGANIASSVSADLSAERGIMLIDQYGDLLLNHAAVGAVEVSYPGGSDLLIDHPTHALAGCATGLACPMRSNLYQSGPGAYTVTATYASLASMGILRGAIFGLDPVEALPE